MTRGILISAFVAFIAGLGVGRAWPDTPPPPPECPPVEAKRAVEVEPHPIPAKVGPVRLEREAPEPPSPEEAPLERLTKATFPGGPAAVDALEAALQDDVLHTCVSPWRAEHGASDLAFYVSYTLDPEGLQAVELVPLADDDGMARPDPEGEVPDALVTCIDETLWSLALDGVPGTFSQGFIYELQGGP